MCSGIIRDRISPTVSLYFVPCKQVCDDFGELRGGLLLLFMFFLLFRYGIKTFFCTAVSLFEIIPIVLCQMS